MNMEAAMRRKNKRHATRQHMKKEWDAVLMKHFGLWCVPAALALAWIGEKALQTVGL